MRGKSYYLGKMKLIWRFEEYFFFSNKKRFLFQKKKLHDRESNPGLASDSRGYLPLYYRGLAWKNSDLDIVFYSFLCRSEEDRIESLRKFIFKTKLFWTFIPFLKINTYPVFCLNHFSHDTQKNVLNFLKNFEKILNICTTYIRIRNFFESISFLLLFTKNIFYFSHFLL